MSPFIKTYDRWANALGNVKVFDLTVWVTLYTLLNICHSSFDLGFTVLLGVATCFRSLRYNPWVWIGFATVGLLQMYFQFHRYEDHSFLAMYWCLALGLSRFGSRNDFFNARSARLLIGLCFAMAFLWKIVSPQFYDGSTFHFKLLFDHRLEAVAGLTESLSAGNYEAYNSIRAPNQEVRSIPLTIPSRVTAIAYLMTGWTILIEGLLAVAFLFSLRFFHKSRDLILNLFMATTYMVVPVIGFAGLFASMGIAQTKSNRWKLAYLLNLLLVSAGLVFRFPIL